MNGQSMNSREIILSGLKDALNSGPFAAVPGNAPVKPSIDGTAASPEKLMETLTGLNVRAEIIFSVVELEAALLRTVAEQGLKSAVVWKNEYLLSLGVADWLKSAGVEILKPQGDAERFCDVAARADFGVTSADCLLYESGSIGVIACKEQERSVSLLPPLHVAIIPPHAPRLTMDEFPEYLRGKAKEFIGMPSGIHLISGPSSTADIELVGVLGVHGPLRVQAMIMV